MCYCDKWDCTILKDDTVSIYNLETDGTYIISPPDLWWIIKYLIAEGTLAVQALNSEFCRVGLRKELALKFHSDKSIIELPLGYIYAHCSDWDEFCKEAGLNPWIFNEGLAQDHDTYYVETATLAKYGILEHMADLVAVNRPGEKT